MGNFAELHKLSRLCISSTTTCFTEPNMFNVHFVQTEIIRLVDFICWFFSVSWIFGRLRPKLVTLWGIPEGDVKRIFCGFKHQGDCGALDPSWLKRLFCLEQFEADAEARVHLNQFWLYSDLIFDIRSFQAPFLRENCVYGSSGQGMNEQCMQVNTWNCAYICVHCGELVCTSMHTRCVCLCVWLNNYTFSRGGSPMQRCQPRMHREVMSQLQFSQLSNLSR